MSEKQTQTQRRGVFKEIGVEIFAAGFSNAIGILVGEPADRIKVLMQRHGLKFPTTMSAAKHIFMKDGMIGFYRGVESPMISTFFMAGLLFGANSVALKVLEGGNGAAADEAPKSPSTASALSAGMFAGFAQCLLMSPTEHLKVQRQLQFGKGLSSFRFIREVIRRDGHEVLTRGFVATAYREVPAFGVYFLTYETLKGMFKQPSDAVYAFAGGMAGVASWVVCYPFDVVKTHLQASNAATSAALVASSSSSAVLNNTLTASRRWEQRTWATARRLYLDQGPAVFMRGMSITLLRAFPVSAVSFVMYEKIKAAFAPSEVRR